jgi:hypothetical protein
MRFAALTQRSITMTTGYDAIQTKKSSLLRKALQGSTFIADDTAPAITLSNLFDTVTGALKSPLPTGYRDLGWITDAGSKFSRTIKNSDLMGFGSNSPLRSDVNSDVTTCVVECEETNNATFAVYTGADISSITPGANGAFSVQNPPVPVSRYYRLLTVVVDLTSEGEVVYAINMPRAKVTDFGDQTLSDGDTAITWPFTFTAYVDEDLGFDVERMWGGDGLQTLESDMGFSRVVTCTTVSASTTLLATTGEFFPDDVDKSVSDGGVKIPADTTIESWTDSTHVVMSAAATAAGTAIAVTVN